MRRRVGVVATWANEVALVAVLIALQVAVTVSFAHEAIGDRDIDALAIVLLVAAPVALLSRHVDPALPVAAVVAALAVYILRGYWLGPVFLALAAALVVAELAGRTIAARAGAGAVMALLVVCLATGAGPPVDPPQVFGICASLTVVIAITALVRTRSDAVRQRAERQAEEGRRVASEARLELARDLHDVLAHSLSVINVQAGAALHLMDDDPTQARDALQVIKSTSRETLGETRAAVETLRGTREAPVTATIGLHDLDRLVESTRPSGLDASIEVTGPPRSLPPRIDIAAYRILQESLTNVTKHSAAHRARVRVAYEPDAVVLTVDDPGPAVPHGGAEPGHGIRGMQERAADLGGRLTAQRRLDGGFTVQAEIPVPSGS